MNFESMVFVCISTTIKGVKFCKYLYLIIYFILFFKFHLSRHLSPIGHNRVLINTIFNYIDTVLEERHNFEGKKLNRTLVKRAIFFDVNKGVL
jgi:hypothetical protein